MPYPVGAEVVVRTLANKRGVIVDAARDGRYRVRVENLITWCREADLAQPPQPGKKKRLGRTAAAPAETAESDAAPAVRLDLHGLTVEEALARLVTAIDRAILKGADRVEVVHGKGSGKIKHAVHKQLRSMPVVNAFKLDSHNTGVTWVYL